jgi:hypothetical protein
MDLTHSYMNAFSEQLLGKYTWLETRNAAAIMGASNPALLTDLSDVLSEFFLYDTDILVAGGNRGPIAIRLDTAFFERGWSAVRVNTEFKLVGQKKKALTSRAYEENFLATTVSNDGFEVDNMKGRVAIDVEWNAKDGNLDRDLAAYRALYDLGLIDLGVIITRDHQGIRDLAGQELGSEDAFRRLGTTTTTNMIKLEPRITRGDAGGCPILAIGITKSTWAGLGVVAPPVDAAVELADMGHDVPD